MELSENGSTCLEFSKSYKDQKHFIVLISNKTFTDYST